MSYRIERDTLGEVPVAVDKYWGAQTERSRNNFTIGPPASMPLALIYAYARLKKACACANAELGILTEAKRDAIVAVCEEIERGELDEHFPLVIWQTGSGTQTNMNLNEVIANRAQLAAGLALGQGEPVLKANDEVNASQSSNDSFPSAMHIAAYHALVKHTLPALKRLHSSLLARATAFAEIIKIGRTHLMDATPLTLGQEFTAFACQLQQGIEALQQSLDGLAPLAIGGTAVGTGLNCPPGFAEKVCRFLQQDTGLPFTSASNKFAALAGHEALVSAHSALKNIALSLNKIANDIRWLGSGPRAGLAELLLPANEPGSSIMPGKVNPTQCEALTMVCAQLVGNDATIGFSQAQGQLQLNVFKPVIIANFLRSAELLADAADSFDRHCVQGLQANREQIASLLENSLMLVTALNPHIGYYKAAEIAQKAHAENTSLQQAALALGYVSAEQFAQWIDPRTMLGESGGGGSA